jgi:hypothetical protein
MGSGAEIVGQLRGSESHRVPWGIEGMCACACLSRVGDWLASGVVL